MKSFETLSKTEIGKIMKLTEIQENNCIKKYQTEP